MYILYNKSLFLVSKRDWKNFCKKMAEGNDVPMVGKLLEYDIKDIGNWDREDYAKVIGLKELPNDLLPIRNLDQGRRKPSKVTKGKNTV